MLYGIAAGKVLIEGFYRICQCGVFNPLLRMGRWILKGIVSFGTRNAEVLGVYRETGYSWIRFVPNN